MLRKLYDWVFAQARKPYAERTMAAVSIAEASFFPEPPNVMLAPMILARPDRGVAGVLLFGPDPMRVALKRAALRDPSNQVKKRAASVAKQIGR